MAHARKAERPVPPIFTLHVPAVLATLAAAAMAALLAVSIFGPIRVGPVADDRIVVSPAVIESGRQWELQRKQQSGYVDPVIESGRQWELQRKQQSGTSS